MPSRSLKLAIDLRARRTWACWPAIVESSSIAASIALASVFASPTPMLSVIFVTFGTRMIESSSSSSLRAGRISSSIALLQARNIGLGRRGHQRSISSLQRLQNRTRDRLALELLDVDADARRLLAGRAHEHDVRDLDRRRLLEDAARRHLRATHAGGVADRRRLAVPLDEIQVLDDDAALARACLDDTALLAAVLAGEHLHGVALLDLHRCCHL